jgi:hypothetical protein
MIPRRVKAFHAKAEKARRKPARCSPASVCIFEPLRLWAFVALRGMKLFVFSQLLSAGMREPLSTPMINSGKARYRGSAPCQRF